MTELPTVSLVALSLLLAVASAGATEWSVCWTGPTEASAAADELARYAGMVLDAAVEVTGQEAAAEGRVFVVTDAANAPQEIAAKLEGLRRDAFAIEYPVQWHGREVCMLVAHDRFGCDYPVYAFLTRFMGVNWVGPGELGVVWAKQPEWELPARISVVENPDFEMRLWSGDSFSSREWLARSSRMGFHHALGHVFHPNKHGDTPEVYPLVGGRRYIPEPAGGPRALSGWQPCTSNPRSIEIATDYVLETLANNPRLISASLAVNDGAGNECECASCRALDGPDAYAPGRRPNLSDRFFHFYNAVIERALAVNPEANIGVLGYGVVSTPPTQVRVNPRIHVFEVQPDVPTLQAWAATGATPALYLWLWDGGFLTVQPDLHMLGELVRAGHELGAIGLYSEIKAHWVISAPKFYVLAHLLWDSSRDVDELLDEYLRLTYGHSALPHVRAYFDRWYEIYRRRPPELLHQNSYGWRDTRHLQWLRRDDLAALDDALARARLAELTDEQRARLDYLRTWHRLMRLNAEQYLVSRELGDPRWVAARGADEVLDTIESSLRLTPDFDRIWRNQVATDTSGWLLDASAQRDPEAYWMSFFAQLRTMVDSGHESAIDDALGAMSERMLVGDDADAVVAWWQERIEERPALERYIGPEMNRLRGVEPESIVVNGSFEEGEPGDPPTLPGWDFYEFYGMVKGVKARYQWREGNGHDGGRAIGMGEGNYPELKAIIHMEEGARYELSLWYRTEGRESPASLWLFSYEGELASPRDIDQERIHKFARMDLEPTDGEWRYVERSLTPSVGGTFVLQLAAYYQKADVWTWFDDIEIRRIW